MHLAHSVLLLLFQKMASRTVPTSYMARLLFGNPQPLPLEHLSCLPPPIGQCICAVSPHIKTAVSVIYLHITNHPATWETGSNSRHLFSLTVCVDQKLESSLDESLWSLMMVKLSIGAAVISKLEGRWNIYFLVGSLRCSASLYPLLTRGPRFLTYGSLHRFAWVASHMASGFPHSDWSKTVR